MFNQYITSKYFLLFTKTIFVVIFLLIIYLFKSSGLSDRENLRSENFMGNNQFVFAKFIDDEFFEPGDTSSSVTHKREKSDLFYYVLGIIILIAAGFILKQRYEQYLKQRDNLPR